MFMSLKIIRCLNWKSVNVSDTNFVRRAYRIRTVRGTLSNNNATVGKIRTTKQRGKFADLLKDSEIYILTVFSVFFLVPGGLE